jgi:hypothetical protein
MLYPGRGKWIGLDWGRATESYEWLVDVLPLSFSRILPNSHLSSSSKNSNSHGEDIIVSFHHSRWFPYLSGDDEKEIPADGKI